VWVAVGPDAVPVDVPEVEGLVVVAGGFIVSAGVSSVLGAVVADTVLVLEPVVLEVVGALDAGGSSGPTSLGVGVDGVVVVVGEVLFCSVLVGATVAGEVLFCSVPVGATIAGSVLEELEAGGFKVGFLVPVDVDVDVGAGSGPAGFCEGVAVAGALEPVDSAVAVDVSVFFTGVPSEGAGMGDGLIDVLSVGAGFAGTTGISLGTRVDSAREARAFVAPLSVDEDSAGVAVAPSVHSPPCIGPSSITRPSSTLFTCTREGRASSTVMRVNAW